MDELAEFSHMPYDISYNIALQTDYPTLMRLCNTSIVYNQICNSEIFWMKKIFQDFTPEEEEYEVISQLYGGKETYKYFRFNKENKNTYHYSLILKYLYKLLKKYTNLSNKDKIDPQDIDIINSITTQYSYTEKIYYPLIVKIILAIPPILNIDKPRTLAFCLGEVLKRIKRLPDMFEYRYIFKELLNYTLNQVRTSNLTEEDFDLFLFQLVKILPYVDIYELVYILNISEMEKIKSYSKEIEKEDQELMARYFGQKKKIFTI